MKPQRIQLCRTAGFNLQRHSWALNGLICVTVARPSRWGNPFIRHDDDRKPWRESAINLFRSMLKGELTNEEALAFVLEYHKGKAPPTVADVRAYLRGKNLACWCPLDQPCHADVLLEMANAPALQDQQ
jgi:hypothetical protein